MWDSSFTSIQRTSTLGDGTGGLWQINLINSSSLEMTGGEVHELVFNNDATAELHGGLIQKISSYQTTEYWDNDNQVWIDTPHIKLYYSGNLPEIDTIGGFDYLVGTWGNGVDDFSIFLHDTGYNVYDNFEFILVPEPATLTLLALGVLLLRRKHN